MKLPEIPAILKKHPSYWIIGAIVLAAALVAILSCGSQSEADQTITPAECSCPAFVPEVLDIIPGDGWTASGGLAFWKGQDDVVHFKGRAIWNASASDPSMLAPTHPTFYTLPAGYRPAFDRLFGCLVRKSYPNPSEQTFCSFLPDGSVHVYATVTVGDSVYFDGITFLAEQ